MGLTNVIKMLAMACPPPVRSARPQTAPPPPTVPPAVDGHRLWLDRLSLHDRLRYDRAFGLAWFAGSGKEDCRVIARTTVERSPHVGPRLKTSAQTAREADRADVDTLYAKQHML